MRVVIVEDKRFFLDLITDSLSGRGIDVVGCADNPSDALRVIDDTAPDLAVLDICLSEARDEVGVRDEEGLRVAELVRANYPDVGLLMLSAYFQPVYAEATDHDRRHINTRVLATLMFLRSTDRFGTVKT